MFACGEYEHMYDEKKRKYILRKYSLHFKYKSEKKIDGLDF